MRTCIHHCYTILLKFWGVGLYHFAVFFRFVLGEAYTGFRRGNLRERDHLGDPGEDGRIILRWFFRQ